MLPTYLQYKPNATANTAQTVTSGNCRFTVLTSRLIRIETGAPTDKATLAVICRDFDTPPFAVTETNGTLTIETEHLTLTYRVGRELSHDSLSIRLHRPPYTEWHYGEQPLHNLGGTVTTLDLVNGACPLGDGVCALDGYALIDDSRTALFDDNGWFLKREDGITDLYFFGYGHAYTAAVQDYTRLTGTPALLPAFALGNWWSRYYPYTEQSYLALMDTFCRHDIPLSVAIVDMDWHLTDGDGRVYHDGWTGYTWNTALFPDPPRFIRGLHDRHLKTALNLHPQSGVRHWEEQYARVAEILGVDPQTKDAIAFDYLNEKLWQAYFEELLFPYEGDGVDFWWMDWQEQFPYQKPTNHPLASLSPLWLLNHFHYRAAVRHGGRGLIFSRFAGVGSQRYPIGFSGDTLITWDSLDFQPYFTATASNIGYGFWSHDIGGHTGGYRDDELTVRWVQFGVFSPIFRLHSTYSDFASREPWVYDKRAETVIADFMRLRHQLFPYIYTMCYRNYAQQIPLILPLYHTHPEEQNAYTVKNEYWYGSELLVAPITHKADAASGLGYADIWLPQGPFVDWFTGDVYRGGHYRVYRPLEQLPVFLKAGGIVPQQAHRPFDNRLGDTERLELVIGAGGNGQFVLYEDDGETTDYQQGAYATTAFTFTWQDTSAVFQKHAAEHDASLTPSLRTYTLYFKGLAAGCRFYEGERELSAVYEETSHAYTLEDIVCEAGRDFAVTVKAQKPMLYDNSGARERMVNILTRAQGPFEEKERWLQKAEALLADFSRDEKARFASEVDNHLAGALFEAAALYHEGKQQKEEV